jgi:hypothetical protein
MLDAHGAPYARSEPTFRSNDDALPAPLLTTATAFPHRSAGKPDRATFRTSGLRARGGRERLGSTAERRAA